MLDGVPTASQKKTFFLQKKIVTEKQNIIT